MSASVMIDYIAKHLSNELKEHLEQTEFFSILTDGSTDTSIIEKEAIFVITFDPTPPGTDKVSIKITYMDLADLSDAGSRNILKCIKNSFSSIIGIDNFMQKLVGFGSDGAAVNSGKKEGVKTLLQQDNPWLTFGWCVAHRLELALKDSLSGTAFDDVDELILRMYYLYKRSPKKLRQLKELVENESFDFKEGGFKPKKASGTRWIAHKVRALDIIIDKYSILMQHLANLAEDKSYASAERAKFKSWLSKWTNSRIPLLACLSVEVLAPAKLLLKSFQTEDVDIVMADSWLNKTKQQLSRLERKGFEELPTIKRFLDNVKEENGKFFYQDVVLKSFQLEKESAKKCKAEWTTLISEAIHISLEMEDSVPSKYSLGILNTEGWVRSTLDPDFMDNGIEELCDFFETPLKNAGFDGTVADVLQQWHDLVCYTTKFLNPQKTDYRVVWRSIFESSQRSHWKLILLIVKLLFTLTVSNAKVERLFSLMNRVKTDTRNSLSQHRLSGLLRICMEGLPFSDFDPVPAMVLWNDSVKLRRPNQQKRKEYKPRKHKERPATLIDISESSESTSESDEEEEV